MVKTLLDKGLVTQALEELRDVVAAYPGEGYADRLEALRTEFGYMCDFMLKGYRDEKRAELFADLSRRIVALDYDLHIRKTLLENPILKVACREIDATYVNGAAVLQKIDAAPTVQERYNSLAITFNALLVSGYWLRKEREEWTAALLAMDSLYASVLVAAIGLSAMNNFCIDKVQCLIDVYKAGDSDKLRQRALVGAVLAASRQDVADSDADAIFKEIMTVPGAAGEVIAMQMQLLACAKAESDATEINKNIMPNLVRNQPFRITKNGFVEKDEEKDSLDPNADERMMDAVKSGVDKMIQMQKNGSDVFFSGFSAMKRFPFFVTIGNWFMPFTKEHPMISEVMTMLGNSKLVDTVLENGPFCDSDKYSFILGYGSVYKSMPDDVKKLVESGEVSPLGMGNTVEQATPSFVRLQYLRDMYRFFKLNSVGKAFYNPFAEVAEYRPAVAIRKHISDAARKTLFSCMLRDEALWTGSETKAQSPVVQLLNSFDDKEGYEALLCKAEYAMRIRDYEMAKECYSKCLRQKSNEPSHMRGMARACYATGEYAKAAFYFDALHTLFPKRKSYVLNYAMAMTMDGMAESVVNDVYKLEYENPGDVNIINTLGWVLLYAGKVEQAVEQYGKILQADKDYADFGVVLNAYYAQLAAGNAAQAVEILRKHVQLLDAEDRKHFAEQLSAAMVEDSKMLETYGIGKAEKSIIVSQFAFL